MNLTYIILFILIHRVILKNKWLISHFIDEETNAPKGRVICSKLQLVETRYYYTLPGFFLFFFLIFSSDLQNSFYPPIEISIFEL